MLGMQTLIWNKYAATIISGRCNIGIMTILLLQLFTNIQSLYAYYSNFENNQF